VPRWDPGSRERLEQAALDLYAERGFDATTVADIAARAGLTERTFFRHFDDKRDVLFAGAEEFSERIVTPVASAAAALAPLDAVALGLEAAAEMLEDRRELARARAAIIAASPELRERELAKLSGLATELARALRERGVGETTATLAGEVALAVFRLSFERWIEEGNERPLRTLIREALAELGRLGAATSALAQPA
jgi:AcrR family transcriptional regulator